MSIGEANDANAGVLLRDLGAEIARCWWREWSGLVKEAMAKLWPSAALPTVTFAREAILLRRPDASGETRIALDEELTGRSAISALRREAAGEGPVLLVFSDEEVLRPVLQLPKAPARVLRKALHFELARLSPVPPDRLYFDFATEGLAPGGSELRVHLRAIRRTSVDAAIAKSRAAGLQVAGIGLGQDARSADWRAFPVDRRAFLWAQWQRFKIVALHAVAGCLALLLLVAIYARGAASLADLSSQMETERTRAAVVEHLRERVAALGRNESFLAAQKQKPLVIATIAELTRLQPDDTWITDLQIAGRKVRLQGYSKSASRLIGQIGSSGRFVNAQFQAPLTQDSTTGSSRFDLSLEVAR